MSFGNIFSEKQHCYPNCPHLLEESLETAHKCTIHKEVLLSRFLLLVFVDKTCRTALSCRFPKALP